MTNQTQQIIKQAKELGYVPEKREEIAYQVRRSKCSLILDHQPNWCGDCFACSECGVRFIPVSWLNQAIDSFNLEKIIELAYERGRKDVNKEVCIGLVREFKDKLIDLCIENQFMRGCVTSNQIIETEKTFWASTHELPPNLSNKED